MQLNSAMCLISGTLRSTPFPWLPVLSNIKLPALRRAATDKLVEKIVKHDSWPIQPDILSPPLLRLTSRKPLWLDLQPVDIKSRWRHNWKSAQVVNSHLVCDPTIRQYFFVLNIVRAPGRSTFFRYFYKRFVVQGIIVVSIVLSKVHNVALHLIVDVK